MRSEVQHVGGDATLALVEILMSREEVARPVEGRLRIHHSNRGYACHLTSKVEESRRIEELIHPHDVELPAAPLVVDVPDGEAVVDALELLARSIRVKCLQQ